MHTADVLLPALRAQISPAAHVWLEDARNRAAHGTVPQLMLAYTEASRHLGRTPLALEAQQRAACQELSDAVVDHWTLEDAGRLLLLLARYEHVDSPAARAAAIECYEQGSAREQQSWLRTIALLPGREQFLAVAIDACRTSILPLFESIACENTYPAAHFPERNFNQLVLKALFNGVALQRIIGLRARLNPELSRMARDYAAERQAAGRPVPADISSAMLDGVAAQRTER
jgi:hypothetical protein